MAGYITRNANILLLFLILLCAAGLVGATIYFQGRFGTINTEYNAKLAQLQNVSRTLEEYQQVLSKAKEELQLKGSREDELTTKFTDVKSEKEQLASERQGLLADKQQLQLSLAETTNRLTVAQNTLAERDVTVATQAKSIATLNGQIVTLKETNSDLRDRIDCLEAQPDVSEATC